MYLLSNKTKLSKTQGVSNSDLQAKFGLKINGQTLPRRRAVTRRVARKDSNLSSGPNQGGLSTPIYVTTPPWYCH